VVQQDLDIAEYTDPLHNPMIPHVIFLEPDLIIHKIYSGPDWDIATPEMKRAWQNGHSKTNRR
jgi:hypothetical protein